MMKGFREFVVHWLDGAKDRKSGRKKRKKASAAQDDVTNTCEVLLKSRGSQTFLLRTFLLNLNMCQKNILGILLCGDQLLQNILPI